MIVPWDPFRFGVPRVEFGDRIGLPKVWTGRPSAHRSVQGLCALVAIVGYVPCSVTAFALGS
eukprot:scaffold132421_cov37-Attheya_sp.AAC.2